MGDSQTFQAELINLPENYITNDANVVGIEMCKLKGQKVTDSRNGQDAAEIIKAHEDGGRVFLTMRLEKGSQFEQDFQGSQDFQDLRSSQASDMLKINWNHVHQ